MCFATLQNNYSSSAFCFGIKTIIFGYLINVATFKVQHFHPLAFLVCFYLIANLNNFNNFILILDS